MAVVIFILIVIAVAPLVLLWMVVPTVLPLAFASINM
jgi:hypothetical protein